MAVAYGLLNHDASYENNEEMNSLSEVLKWPGSVEHKFCCRSLSGGLILHPLFNNDISEFLYINENEGVLVLLSGYFYNRNELQECLRINKREISNPELALMLFRNFGKDFVNKINGDFFLLIYMSDPDSLLLYRDHLGIRPVCYTVRDDLFWFSSDGPALCKALYSDLKIDPRFLLNFIDDPDRIDINLLPCSMVKKLLPGHYLQLSGTMKPAITKYWFPENILEDNKLDFETAKGDLNELVKDSVFIRCDKKFNAGAHLSGGLDSGIVAALARSYYQHQNTFRGFSWSPGNDEQFDVEFDERKLVYDIGRKCNIEPVFTKLRKEDFSGLYTDWRFIMKFVHEPLVRKNAQKENINLIFSGWGGDEFISINSRGIDSDLFFKFQWKSFFRKNPVKNPVRVFNVIISKVLLPALGMDFPAFRPKNRRSAYYLKTQVRRYKSSPLYKWRSRRDVHLALLNFGHLSQRTENWFNHGYRDGIEYRYPLLDKRIIEYMLKVPSRLLFKNGFVRLMLREAGDGILPDPVTWAKDKSNPVIAAKSIRVNREVFSDTFRELERFKMNRDLNFVNFELLEKNVGLYQEKCPDTDAPDPFSFLIALKYLHEFTNGYYG